MNEKIGVLGPKGTFTEVAARKLMPDALIEYLDDVEDIFEYVKTGKGKGVVAIENSLEGSVGKTMAGLLEYDVKVCGETTLDINMCLIANPDSKQDEVEIVRSHPHALAQCKRYIREKMPKAKIQATSSTAQAIKEIKERKNISAIGNKNTALEEGYEVLAENIQDHDSQTRFICITDNEGWGDKTSIIIALIDEPGSLYSIVKVFADNNINMTKIESRPSRKKLGEYLFYIDFENNGMDKESLKIFLLKIEERTSFFKNLGSY